MTEQVKILITPDGIKADASGFIGGKCTIQWDELEKYLAAQGVMTAGKDQKRKLEQMYASSPDQTIQR